MPSDCASKLKAGSVDLALVPVALIPELETHFIETDFCIGANGKVDSVKLYSEVPIEKIETVMMDYQSRTSNALAKILFEKHWNKSVDFLPSHPGFESQVSGTVAAVVIGDRCFGLNGKFNYEYDLAEEWKTLSGLPFVFAAWVSRHRLDKKFITEFNKVLMRGIKNIAASVQSPENRSSIGSGRVMRYLTQNISYDLNDEKKKGLELFLNYLKEKKNAN